MITVNIHQAKAQLSYLIEQALKGEEVRVCKRNVPLVEIKSLSPVAVSPKKERPIGFYKGQFKVPDSFFEPMSEEELALWEGAGLDEHMAPPHPAIKPAVDD